uniref:Small ribosomal subunit protein bS18c n=1 Tax=Melanthalia intermedia TaxID=172989 RepID=A0A345UAR5_9FLOR|nr:ribosomal protein S18 [Melanthalia intermedia]AXI97551.1 ribosomal protein S18 [Melanthalia intermedia]
MIFYNKKNSSFKEEKMIDYKDIDLLRGFITDQGKIISRRLTGLTTKQQKQLTKYVKRARILALLPFANKD